MEVIYICGNACSGKSTLAKRIVTCLGADRAQRLPLDHYYLDATCPEHSVRSHISGFQRDRIDWDLLNQHLDFLASGQAIDTPRYDWEDTMKRVPQESGIGRSHNITPGGLLFVDGMHPTFDAADKHIFVSSSEDVHRKLCEVRATQMPVPDNYFEVVQQVTQTLYGEALQWLEENAWKKVTDHVELDIDTFCKECKWI